MFGETCIKWYFIFTLALFCEASTNISRINPYGMWGLPPLPPSYAPIPLEYFFNQILDHSNTENYPRTWDQRYYVVKDYYKVGGPVFLMIWGEGESKPEYMVKNAWVEYAKNYNALMIMLEHRFYGPGRPFSDLSLENLKYLSSEQALADVAYFIVGMDRQHKLPPDTKWVAFGGSYAGNLAAWVRYKYPHLVHAAVASSAPVLARVNYPDLLGAVRDSLSTQSSECVQAVKEADGLVQSLLKTHHGRYTIWNIFGLCYPIEHNNPNDVSLLIYKLLSPFAIMDRTENKFCNIMVSRNMGDLLVRYSTVNKVYRRDNHQERCLDYRYESFINNINKKVNYQEFQSVFHMNAMLSGWHWESENQKRAWFYQQCTEFGYFATSPFYPIDYYAQQCGYSFGEEFTWESLYQAVDRTNKIYGGLDINATRVVYVHGSLDPWHTLGITKTRIPESPAIFIIGTGHCADLTPPSHFDPPALRAARKEINRLIGQWLGEACYN